MILFQKSCQMQFEAGMFQASANIVIHLILGLLRQLKNTSKMIAAKPFELELPNHTPYQDSVLLW